MKNITLLVVTLSLVLFSSQAAALDLSFFGAYNFTDTTNDGFTNELVIGTGTIGFIDPSSDGLFGDSGTEIVTFNQPLQLDASSYVVGSHVDFAPTVYPGGFSVFDDDGSLVFTADLTVPRLHLSGTSTANINPAFSVNLTNIITGPTYVSGSSVIIDGYLAAQAAGLGGGVNITLQTSGTIEGKLLNGGSFGGTYSGSTSPVPEPTSLALLGFGLLSCFAFARRKK
jgi:hypothetical protein